jgi:hypothetical protein
MIYDITAIEVQVVKEAVEAAISELKAVESEEGWVLTTDCFALCAQALQILNSLNNGHYTNE